MRIKRLRTLSTHTPAISPKSNVGTALRAVSTPIWNAVALRINTAVKGRARIEICEPKSEIVCPAQKLRKLGWCHRPAGRNRLSIGTLSRWSRTEFSFILSCERVNCNIYYNCDISHISDKLLLYTLDRFFNGKFQSTRKLPVNPDTHAKWFLCSWLPQVPYIEWQTLIIYFFPNEDWNG